MPRKDCDPLSALIARLALNIGTQPGMKNLSLVAEAMKSHLPEISREEIVRAINESSLAHARAISDTQRQLADLRREARTDKALKAKIDELQGHIDAGTTPTPASRQDRSPDAIKALRSIRDHIAGQIRQGEPARRLRLLQSIDSLTERLEAVREAPPQAAASKPVSQELARLMYERDELQRQIRETINSWRPKTFFHRAAEPLNTARAIMTSVDFSAVLRQGGFIAIGHPIRATRALPAMFKAAASERYARASNAEIKTRANAPMYSKADLYLAEHSGASSKAEEAYRSDWAERIPLLKHVVKSSQRAYTTFLNTLRADSFDAMAETLGRDGVFTEAEAKAVAEFINIATGRGAPNRQVGEVLTAAFFSPRYVASRFQLLAAPLTGFRFGGGSLRTRKLIAREYARYIAGLGVVYGLANLAGAELEFDPRSSDFGKIKLGDTRIDPLSGMSQAAVLVSRLSTGQRKTLDSKELIPTQGGFQTTVEFLRNKLAPIPAASFDVADIASGRRPPPGHPQSYREVGQGLVTPMSFRDIHDSMVEHGIPKGAALGLLAVFGAGVQTYDERNTRTGRPSRPGRAKGREQPSR